MTPAWSITWILGKLRSVSSGGRAEGPIIVAFIPFTCVVLRSEQTFCSGVSSGSGEIRDTKKN